MPLGGGKYDQQCETVFNSVEPKPQAALVIILTKQGLGSGFSLSMNADEAPEVLVTLPAVLRSVASKIEADIRGLKSGG